MSSSWTFLLLNLTKWRQNDVNFNSKKIHEDDIFVRQDILQFSSEESKDYKYLKSP